MSVSEEAIQTVMLLMEDEFDKCRIHTESVKREIVRRLLTEENVIAEALGKYDVIQLMKDADTVQSLMEETTGHPVTLYVQLTPDEQNTLIRGNRDMRIIFEQGPFYAHALAWAQRCIDTTRCMRYLSRTGGDVIDIGGNYAAHKRSMRVMHCCNLVDTVREQHRQAERLLNLQSEGAVIDTLDYCMDGAQNCNRQAVQAMSIHAMPDIPWEDWPEIMDRHGLEYLIGVFHYDASVLLFPSGTLEGSAMNYYKHGDEITFHFELDSSFSYTHRWSNYLKYLAPWCQQSTSSPYAYVYDIKSIVNGVLTAEIYRIPKATLGRQVLKPVHAYVPREHVVQIDSVIYDMSSMLDVKDPMGYVPVKVNLDADMYNFMYMYGVANDVADPNRVMDISTFRAMMYTYNHTRKFGDIVISARKKIPGTEMDQVIMALFHVVVRERALMKVKSDAYTSYMIKRQRMHNLPWASVALLVPVLPVVAPLLMIGGAFQYYVSEFTNALKKVAAGMGPKLEVSKPDSYIRLKSIGYGDVDGYDASNAYSFFRRPLLLVDKERGRLTDKEFSELLGTVREDDVSDSASVRSSVTVSTVSASFVKKRPGLPKGSSYLRGGQRGAFRHSADSIAFESREEFGIRVTDAELNVRVSDVYDQEFGEQRAVAMATTRSVDHMESVADVDLLHSAHKQMMLEYAVYCFDCGHGVVQTLKRNCLYYMPGGTLHMSRTRGMNAATDIGVKTFDVLGTILPLEAAQYMIGVDPFTGNVHHIHKSPDGRSAYIDATDVQSLYVEAVAKVFNHFKLGKAALRAYRCDWVPKFEMTLVDGVPGCGKTTEIVNTFQITDAIVCAVRHSKDDTLARLLKCDRFEGLHDIIRTRVRTADSVMCNGFRGTEVDTLFIDEGLMMFPGQVYAVASLFRPRVVRVFGDSWQIKAIDRSPSLGVLAFPSLRKWTAIETRNVSWSMPADVTVLLSKLVYGREIFTRSPVRRSLKVNHRPSQDDPVYTVPDPDKVYLTRLVADKGKLLSNRGFVDGKALLEKEVEDGAELGLGSDRSRVFTVHESQGQRLSKVALVRMNPQASLIFDSVPHTVVSVSRHYLECVNNTVSMEDKLVRFMNTPVSEEELDAVSLEPPDWLIEKIDKMRSC